MADAPSGYGDSYGDNYGDEPVITAPLKLGYGDSWGEDWGNFDQISSPLSSLDHYMRLFTSGLQVGNGQ